MTSCNGWRKVRIQGKIPGKKSPEVAGVRSEKLSELVETNQTIITLESNRNNQLSKRDNDQGNWS